MIDNSGAIVCKLNVPAGGTLYMQRKLVYWLAGLPHVPTVKTDRGTAPPVLIVRTIFLALYLCIGKVRGVLCPVYSEFYVSTFVSSSPV